MSMRTKQTGEVFTPRSLIREMLNTFPNEVWFDPNKTWLEPAAGDGNFLVEIKARLLQAGHDEKHILDNMLFSVELIDDNHWVLQHRLGYLVDGQPNPKFWPNGENFEIGQIHQIAQDLNGHNPYYEQLGLDKDQVLFHRNHVCTTALEYDMSFSRADDEFIDVLEVLPSRDLGPWPETDTPDIGESYIVERMLGRQPQLTHQEPKPEKKLKHPHINEVTLAWIGDVPKKEPCVRQIYEVSALGCVGYGETNFAKERIPNGYVDRIRTMKHDGSLIIKAFQQLAVENGNRLDITARIVQIVQGENDIDARRLAVEAESQWIVKARAEGKKVLRHQ
jgi:hypothetical protein